MTRPHGVPAKAILEKCRCQECLDARYRSEKRYRAAKARGQVFRVPVAPLARRVQALQAMGHTVSEIAEEAGMNLRSLSHKIRQDNCSAENDQKIRAAYRRLEMVVPEDSLGARMAKGRARKHGWPPPLAYENIDTGELANQSADTTRFDEVLVDSLIGGSWHLAPSLSRPERVEVYRRWVTVGGRSELSLSKATGWRASRYKTAQEKKEDAA